MLLLFRNAPAVPNALGFLKEQLLPHAGAKSCTAAAILYWDRLLTSGRESTAFYAEFTSAPADLPSLAVQEPLMSLPRPANAANAQFVPSEPPRPAWYYMPLPERQAWVQQLIGQLVTKALGKEVAESQPLMMAGLDSLGRPRHCLWSLCYHKTLCWPFS